MKAVILAGGGGTRLWPFSTEEKPKQFLKLFSNKTLIEETIERLDFLQKSDIYISINKNHLSLTEKICENLKIPTSNIITEPDKRDTASAIGYAAAIIEKNHPGEVMALISADHYIGNKEEFQKKLQKAVQIANNENTLNIVEVIAKTPNTNFGYVKLGKQIDEDTYEIDKFTEKPDLKTAEEFLESGNYLWNTGMYVWKASVLLEQYKKLKPETYTKLTEIVENPEKTEEIYPTLEKISIDYAIMERVDPKKIRIIKADIDWMDIGNWHTLYDILKNQNTTGDVHIVSAQEMNQKKHEKHQADDITICIDNNQAYLTKT
ncbi:mannose-1-phosphate guanylyltransferase [Candidatus Peregrinibacteria bacterium CG10_big_fil_rev_8_21_14_0_10_36_19]|nr:MAG: mannose-1-phosphate guanylyltransferase [Candidatus Peregrinibacteria bacterium CG10_big_fil_rev_8_21_14_0_10_36_19]